MQKGAKMSKIAQKRQTTLKMREKKRRKKIAHL